MSAATSSDPASQHLLYVLLDSNLPTGGFVASSGLESYAKHGFLRPAPALPYDAATTTMPSSSDGHLISSIRAGPSSAPALGPSRVGPAIIEFATAEIDNFEKSTGWYLSSAWRAVHHALHGTNTVRYEIDNGEQIRTLVDEVCALDTRHESTLLSHVARRASRAQGIATLTLFGRGLGPPPGFHDLDIGDEDRYESGNMIQGGMEVVDEYKRRIRRGDVPGHLAVCWGVMTAILGIDHDTARHLYLFTHARSILSAAVRLNLVGPYLSTQLLAHPIRTLLARIVATKYDKEGEPVFIPATRKGDDTGFWDWADTAERGPATTWPLGEILAARHDLQHSRIFNS